MFGEFIKSWWGCNLGYCCCCCCCCWYCCQFWCCSYCYRWHWWLGFCLDLVVVAVAAVVSGLGCCSYSCCWCEWWGLRLALVFVPILIVILLLISKTFYFNFKLFWAKTYFDTYILRCKKICDDIADFYSAIRLWHSAYLCVTNSTLLHYFR